MSKDMVIAVVSQDKKILRIENFISDEQYQKMIVEAKKKNCRTKMLSRGDAKYHMDHDLPITI